MTSCDDDRRGGEDLSANSVDVERLLGAVRRFVDTLPRCPVGLRIRTDRIGLELDWAPTTPASATPSGTEGQAGSVTSDDDGTGLGSFVCAPSVGTFHRAASPGAAPFAAVGDLVGSGQQLAIVEAMKLMLPVKADRAGRVAAVLKADGDPVEFGDPLFELASVDE